MKNKVIVFIGLIITLAFISSLNNSTVIKTNNKNYATGYTYSAYAGTGTSNYKYTPTQTTSKPSTIRYTQSSYSCVEGQTIDTMIRAYSSNVVARITGYGSSNNRIATVEANPDLAVNCVSCAAVRITCKKTGNVNLYAKSSDGVINKTPVEVKPREDTVSFDKSSYTCLSGDSFTTMIRSTGFSSISYESRNTRVATIEANQGLQTNCINCTLVRINCYKPGTTRLVARTSSGATQTVRIRVQ